MRRWSAGQNSQSNARFFARNSRGPSAINRDCVARLENLINNCRNEVSRSPLLDGVIDTDTNALVGEHGPHIDIVCDARGGDAWATAAESIINDWAAECCITGQRAFTDLLTAINRGLWTDGCGLIEERTARRSDGPVSLRLALHDPLYLATPPDLLSDPSTVMGVQVNADGAPIRYHIGEITDRTHEIAPWLKSRPRPADLVHHITDPLHMEASQLRGVPYAGSTLEASAQLRSIDKAVLDALETAAKMNILLTTTDSKLRDKIRLLKGSLSLSGNGATAIPPGYEANGIASQHPHQKYLELAEMLLAQLGRPVSMPVTLVLASFRSANFSAGRMDGGLHRRSVDRRRGVIQRQFVNRVIKQVVIEAQRARALGKAPGRWSVQLTWPSAIIQPDPAKHYLAQQIAIANGTLSLSQAAAENGYTLEQVAQQNVRDRQFLIDHGLPIPEHLAGPATNATPASHAASARSVAAILERLDAMEERAIASETQTVGAAAE